MPGPGDLTRDVDIDIAGLLREVWKRLWLVIALPLAAGIALFLFLGSMDPSYKAGARVIIEKRESVFTRRTDNDFSQSGGQFDEQAVGSQVEVLTSADLALKVIERLNLTEHEDFRPKPSVLADLLALVGAGGGPQGDLTPQERILTDFTERLSVYAIEKSRVIAIEFWAHDRELAQAVPNALADEYLAVTKAAQLDSTEQATGWLGTEIEELSAKVRAAEARVAEYRASSDILVGDNNALLATQQLSETSSELSRVRSERSAADGKAAAIRSALEQGASIDTLPEVISSPLIQRLREREAAIQAEISELETSLLPSHPRLKALKSQIADYQAQIRTSARNILESLENNVDLLRRQETLLLAEVNRLKAEAGRVGEAEVELRALEREATAQRELLETYLTRFREAASRQNRDYLPVDARIISRAVTPAESFFPKVVPFTAAGIMVSLVLVVTGILAWALLAGKAFKEIAHPDAYALPERAYLTHPSSAGEAATVQMAEPVRRRVDRRSVSDEPDEVDALSADLGAAIGETPADATGERVRNFGGASAGGIYVSLQGDDSDGWRYAAAREPADTAEYAQSLEAAIDVASRGHGRILEAEPLPTIEAPGLYASGAEASEEPAPFAFGVALDAIASLGQGRLAVVSPAGDEGSVIAWEAARRLADAGKSVLIVDLTGSGVTSEEFAGTNAAAGLREMLSGEVLLRDAIRRDRLGRAYVLPSGSGGSLEDLGLLSQTAASLTRAFDFVVFDCGLAGAEGLAHVVSNEDVVLVSAEGAVDGEVAAMEADLRTAGFVETVAVAFDAEDRRMFEASAA